LDDVAVGFFVPAADVVGFARLAGLQYAANGAAMVADVEPVAHLQPVAVQRQWLAGQGVDDAQGDEFFRKLQRPVVVAAMRGNDGQAPGVMPGARQVVAGGFAGGVGAVGAVGVVLGKGHFAWREAAVDLVGGDVDEAKARALRFVETAPIRAHGFKQVEGGDDVGLDKGLRPGNGAVYVAFGGEVDERARAVLRQQGGDGGGVAHVGVHEGVARVVAHAVQVVQIAGVGEFVDVEHRLVARGEPVQHEVGTNESGTAGNENHGSGFSAGGS